MELADFLCDPSLPFHVSKPIISSHTNNGQPETDGWEEKIESFHRFVSRRKEELQIHGGVNVL